MGLFDGIKKKMEEIEHRRIANKIYSQPSTPRIAREVPAELELNVEMDWEEGSKKQQSWANRLVREFLKEVKSSIDDAVKSGSMTKEQAEMLNMDINRNIIYQDDANWWIDNQDMNIRKKLQEICSSNEEIEKIIKRVAY